MKMSQYKAILSAIYDLKTVSRASVSTGTPERMAEAVAHLDHANTAEIALDQIASECVITEEDA